MRPVFREITGTAPVRVIHLAAATTAAESLVAPGIGLPSQIICAKDWLVLCFSFRQRLADALPQFSQDLSDNAVHRPQGEYG